MGTSTVDALRRFQAAAGLPVTGDADSNTMVALGIR
jgi:peptidoglycan hydrolase-like protein with peptidoglycan-binding domain